MPSSSPYRLPGMELIDHTFDLPLDYSRPDDRRIRVFVREVRDLDPESRQKPFLLFCREAPVFGPRYRSRRRGGSSAPCSTTAC